jgi:hypothetical protein
VEALELSYTAAGTFDARNVTGATSLEITNIGADVAVTRLAASVTTLSITENTAIDDTSITYTTGADSAVTLTVGASDTTSANLITDIGNVTVAGNEGAFTLASRGEAANLVDAVAANDAASLTLDALTRGLTTTTVSATSATAVTLNATAGDLTVTNVTASDAEGLTLAAIGGSVTANSFVSDADIAVTINATGDNVSIGGLLDVDHLSRLAINATGGDVTIADMEITHVDASGDALAQTIDITAAAGQTVTISDMSSADTDTDVTITIVGAGTVSITSNDDNIDVGDIDASAHTGVLTLDFGSNINNAMTVFIGSGADHETGDVNTVTTGAGDDDITGGAGDDIIVTGIGGDTIVAGAGDDDITGGDGVDEITTGAGSDVIRFTANNMNYTDADVIIDFAAGDDGDIIAVDVSDAAGGAAAFLDDANFVDLLANAADNSIIVMSAASYADFAAVQFAINGANPGTEDYMVAFLNSTTGVAEVYIGNTSAGNGFGVLLASLDNIVTLAGVADLTADNFLTF